MLKQKLKHWFGFSTFKTGQKEVIQRLVHRSSAAAIFPTGSGKSLCYQLPALLLPHLTLVVSPLLALMKDQVDFLTSHNIPAARLDSTLTSAEYDEVLVKARYGNIKILMISVERFKNERFRYHLEKMKISLLVVDEAHCISQWGHNFRPEYLKLPTYAKAYGVSQILLLTATATPPVIDDMCAEFEISRENVIITGFYRKNLFLKVTPAKENEKRELLVNKIQSDVNAATIIYVTLQHTAETISEFLRDKGLRAACYHAGMKSEVREAIQNGFMEGELNCVVATIAFGMGIDKSDIRRIIHFDLPKTIENYSQEVGRAGRDGKIAQCEIFANKDNLCLLENFIYGDTPEEVAISNLLFKIKSQPESIWEVKLNTLSFDLNIRMLPLKTLLVYLEMAAILQARYSYFQQYSFQYIDDAKAICHRFQGERHQFVACLFSHCTTKKIWTHVDVNAILADYNTDRNRVVAALSYFDEKGWIRLQAGQSVEVFDILDQHYDVNDLAKQLYHQFKEKEAHEIRRIHHMVQFFQNDKCLSKSLADYFGESLPLERCGHCSVCFGRPANSLPMTNLPPLSDMDFSQLISDFTTNCGSQISATQAAKFLCGITTPYLIRMKAKAIPNFGALKQYPFGKILKRIEKNNIFKTHGNFRKNLNN
jgi:ATP-dependent DNA helicase RecQ